MNPKSGKPFAERSLSPVWGGGFGFRHLGIRFTALVKAGGCKVAGLGFRVPGVYVGPKNLHRILLSIEY